MWRADSLQLVGAVSVGLSLSDQCQDPRICSCSFTPEDTVTLPKLMLISDHSQILFVCPHTSWRLQIVGVQENKIRTAGSFVALGGADLNHSAIRFISTAWWCTAGVDCGGHGESSAAQPVEYVAVASDGCVFYEFRRKGSSKKEGNI